MGANSGGTLDGLLAEGLVAAFIATSPLDRGRLVRRHFNDLLGGTARAADVPSPQCNGGRKARLLRYCGYGSEAGYSGADRDANKSRPLWIRLRRMSCPNRVLLRREISSPIPRRRERNPQEDSTAMRV
jgi:hypothetical protein